MFRTSIIVKRFASSRIRRIAAGLAISASLFPLACGRTHRHVLEVAYVSTPQAALRDQVAAISNHVGNVKNGERLEVLEREKRFARVRTATGIEGWIEQRYLIDQKTYDGLQKLTQEKQSAPVQAPGVLRNETNLHIRPGRETEHLYQLASGAKVSILERATAEKQERVAQAAKPVLAKSGEKAAAEPHLEDWWLVRDESGRVGWVLARMVDVDVPLDIAQYAEGQRFVAFSKLNEVQDQEKKVPQYLCVLTEPHDGLPYDFDQVRVFTWNVKKHRYETAYREHGVDGVLPVTVTQENFDKEGTLPVFLLRVKDDAGNISERKYKLNTPIVRRVLAPGESMPKPIRRRR
ncbi:MAG TPA: SH3 domain-containing protein [Candidatus Solibacter sp.]|nr:SH3 domain-containing protein [Candidatus Solibacter sp.]